MKGKMLPVKKILAGVTIFTMLASVPALAQTGGDKTKLGEKGLHKNGTGLIAESRGDGAPDRTSFTSYEKTLTLDSKWMKKIDDGFTLFEDSAGNIKALIREKKSGDLRSSAAEVVDLYRKLDEVEFSGTRDDIEIVTGAIIAGSVSMNSVSAWNRIKKVLEAQNTSTNRLAKFKECMRVENKGFETDGNGYCGGCIF